MTVDNDDEHNKDDDAVHLRWTGANTLLSTQLQLTHTMTVRGPRTTWATPTAKAVTSLHSMGPCFPPIYLPICLHLCKCPYVINSNKYCTSLVFWHPQVSSTTSSVCLLLRRRQQLRTLQTWMEPKWSAPSRQLNPGNLPIITALVRNTLQYN